MVKQYQVLLDPVELAAYGIPHAQAVEAIQKANQEAGGSVLEMGEARSEEHTSELQSLMRNSYAVFCLKNKKYQLNKYKNNKTNVDKTNKQPYHMIEQNK